MKIINEKHLAHFAVGNAPVEKEGYLMKRGDLNKSFQKRWFCLKGNLLFYFEKRYDREPVGVIILEGCTVELSENPDAFTFELVYPGVNSRTYVLAAETQEHMEEWMKAITCAGYEYMKVMVTELQQQLDELNKEHQNASLNWNRSHKATALGAVPEAKTKQPRGASVNGNGARSSNVEQLIDFSESGPVHPQRKNPFNNFENLDIVGSTSSNIIKEPAPFPVSVSSTNGNGVPSFDNLHRRYGDYIQRQMLAAKANIS